MAHAGQGWQNRARESAQTWDLASARQHWTIRSKINMDTYPQDIYTEPANQDGDTLKNLGPLTGMAGILTGGRGLGVQPKGDGARKQGFVERVPLQPRGSGTTGPRMFY